MDSIRPTQGPTTQYDYFAIAKAGATSVALMALSIGAMKGIERVWQTEPFTPFQRNLAFTALSAIYIIGAARFGGPFTKELPLSKKKDDPSNRRKLQFTTYKQHLHNHRSTTTGPQSIVPRRRSISTNPRQIVQLNRNPIDLTSIDPKVLQVSLAHLMGAIRQNGFLFVQQTFPLNGRVITIQIDISTERKRMIAFRVVRRWQLDLQPPYQKALLPAQLPVEEVPAQQQVDEVVDDNDGFFLVDEPVQASPRYSPVQYVEGTHGVNGSLMRESFFGALLVEIKRSIEEQGINVRANLAELEERFSWCLSYEDSYLKTMYRAFIDDGRDPETRYGELVMAHRNLINLHRSDNTQPISAKRIISQAFVRARMSPKMQVFQESFVGQFIGEHGRKLTLENFPKEFVARNSAVKSAPAEMKMHDWSKKTRQLCGALSWEDYFTVNPPNLLETMILCKEEEERTVEYIRESTPHISGATIDPTFRENLTILQSEGKGFLYAAHQRLKDQKEGLGYWTQLEVEDARSQTLIELERDHPNFILIFQSVENDLFKNGAATIDELKKKIKESFTNPSGRNQNRLPHFLQSDEAYKARMDEMLNDIHTIFFPGQDRIVSVEQRLSFIMIFYAMQRHDLITGDYNKEYPVGAFTTPCKDFYDRGLGQAIMTRLLNLIQIYGKEIPSEKLEEVANAGQFPPLIGKGLAAIPHRIDPALGAIKRIALLDLDPFRELNFNGWKVVDTKVHRFPEQSAIPRMIEV